MKKLIIIQTVAPDYREGFFNNILKNLKESFELYSGDYYFDSTIKSSTKIKRIKIKNFFLVKRKILFQTGMWHLIFANDVIVLELNPRIISNWIFIVVRWFFKKEIYVWGHVWGRKGKNSKRDFLRNIMRKLSSGVIVYTNRQKIELQTKTPNKIIFSAPNSLFASSQMRLAEDDSIRKNIISVCRLVSEKKIIFLVKSFIKGIKKIPNDTKLIIVGDGDEKEQILKLIEFHNLSDRIELLGHISDFKKLEDLYSKAFFSVSAGYIGLSVTQSFGFGVPMLVSKDESHSPEIEAVKAGKNAVFFKTNDEEDLIDKITQIFSEREYWRSERKKIVEFCKTNYSTEAMAKVFIDLV